jgi:hypothetical protein
MGTPILFPADDGPSKKETSKKLRFQYDSVRRFSYKLYVTRQLTKRQLPTNQNSNASGSNRPAMRRCISHSCGWLAVDKDGGGTRDDGVYRADANRVIAYHCGRQPAD